MMSKNASHKCFFVTVIVLVEIRENNPSVTASCATSFYTKEAKIQSSLKIKAYFSEFYRLWSWEARHGRQPLWDTYRERCGP